MKYGIRMLTVDWACENGGDDYTGTQEEMKALVTNIMTDCVECKCPHNWHNYVTGHCYGCNKDCKTEIHPPQIPFEIAQDMDTVRLGKIYNVNRQ